MNESIWGLLFLNLKQNCHCCTVLAQQINKCNAIEIADGKTNGFFYIHNQSGFRFSHISGWGDWLFDENQCGNNVSFADTILGHFGTYIFESDHLSPQFIYKFGRVEHFNDINVMKLYFKHTHKHRVIQLKKLIYLLHCEIKGINKQKCNTQIDCCWIFFLNNTDLLIFLSNFV